MVEAGKSLCVHLRQFWMGISYQIRVSLAVLADLSGTVSVVAVMTRGGAIKFFGTENHHVKWLKDTENYVVKGCFPMTELGHGSNVRGIETVTTYDSKTGEFIINTPCESAQKFRRVNDELSSFRIVTFTWHNMRTLQECREACGGQGLKTENRVGRLKGEFNVQSTFEGDNDVLMQQALFTEYLAAQKRKAFKGLGLEPMNKSCPAIPSHLSSSVLRRGQFQNKYCDTKQMERVRSTAFMSSYSLAEDLRRSFSERFILQKFLEMEETLLAGPLKDVLSLIRTMYSLVSMEEDAAFLRYGYLSAFNAASVREEVLKLCRELRPHALALVNSLGIPDPFLSPIAFDTINKAIGWPVSARSN